MLVFVAQLSADTIRLINGDSVSGEVVSLNAKELKLKSEILGEITIARSKIATIQFGDAPAPQPVAGAEAAPQYNIPKLPAVTREQAQYSGQGGSVEDAVKQLQNGGVDPEAVKQITRNLPGFASPEVQKYFNNTLGGLASGKLNVQDIRADAIRARDQLIDLKKDLGPEAAALDGYLGILNHFIAETEPPKAKAEPETATPDKAIPDATPATDGE